MKDLTLINCTAKQMRGGFELRTKGGGVVIRSCEATGCERGFWVGNGATIEACRGDSQFGPLLYLEGKGAHIDLTWDGQQPRSTVHALAAVSGSDHEISIAATTQETTGAIPPILIGYSAPPAGEGMCFLSARDASNIMLENRTPAPVIVRAKSETHTIDSDGQVTYDDLPRR